MVVLAGYTTDDVFYLEVCMYSQICANGNELFELMRGEDFYCKFSRAGYQELQQTLLEGDRWEPMGSKQCAHGMQQG